MDVGFGLAEKLSRRKLESATWELGFSTRARFQLPGTAQRPSSIERWRQTPDRRETCHDDEALEKIIGKSLFRVRVLPASARLSRALGAVTGQVKSAGPSCEAKSQCGTQFVRNLVFPPTEADVTFDSFENLHGVIGPADSGSPQCPLLPLPE